MTHDQAAQLIEAAALVPGRLRALVAAESADGEALRSHLAGCDECRGELDAWQAVDEALVAVTPESVGAPPAARDRILATVLATGVARAPDRMLGTPAAAAAAGATGIAAGATAPAAPAAAPGIATASVAGSGPAAPPVPVPAAAPAAAAPAPVSAAMAPVPASATAPAGPHEGRVWRTPSGRPMPSPTATQPGAAPGVALGVSTEPIHPEAAAAAAAQHEPAGASPTTADRRRGLRVLPGGGDREGVGFRVFLAVAAAAVFLFVLGAAFGGPLGLTTPTTVVQPDTTARVELEKALGRMSDLLQQPGAQVAPLTDQAGEPAGFVVVASPDSNLLGVVTRALPAPTGDQRYVCLLIRGDQRYEVGYMKFAGDPDAPGDVAYWVGPLKDELPLDVGAPGDVFSVYVDGSTSGDPLLTATF